MLNISASLWKRILALFAQKKKRIITKLPGVIRFHEQDQSVLKWRFPEFSQILYNRFEN